MKPASLLRSPELLVRAACELGAATDMVTRGVAALSSAYFSSTQPAVVYGAADAQVLFVHGMLGNHSWSAPLARALQARGYRTASLDYRTVGVGLDDTAGAVAAAIDATVPAGRPIHIVAHSLGGLVIRSVAAQYGLAERFASVTTLAAPHNGTPLALRPAMQLPKIGQLVRDLHPASQSLARLVAAEQRTSGSSAASGGALGGDTGCRWTAVYSPDDELVPDECGRLSSTSLNATNIALAGLGHFSITTHRSVLALVAGRICEQDLARYAVTGGGPGQSQAA